MKYRISTFLVVAWLLSPLLAGLLGWAGIWGTGSAFFDYAIPFPTAGGLTHLPSIIACALLIGLRGQGAEPLATLSRPLLLGLSLAGLAWLIDMNDLVLAMTTDAGLPRASNLVEPNPLGLFMLVDGLLAQAFLPRNQSAERGVAWLAAGALAILVPPAIVGSSTYRMTPTARYALVPGASRPGPARSDEIVTIYSASGFDPARLQAELNGDPSIAVPPERHANAEAQAIYFFDSLNAARNLDLDAARLTLCRYEDGTPARWIEGTGDCFTEHVGFSERLERLLAAADPGLSPGVRSYVALRSACDGVALEPNARFSDIESQRRCAALARLRADVLASPGLNDRDRETLTE